MRLAVCAVLIGCSAFAEDRPSFPNFPIEDHCTKLAAALGDNPMIRDSCRTSESESKKTLERVWVKAPVNIETECLKLMAAGGQSNYQAVSGCLAGGVGNLWLKGDLTIAPAR